MLKEKRLFSYLTIVTVICCVLFSPLYPMKTVASNPVTVKVDGAVLPFDVQPEIIDGRTMVPFRLIFEALGAEVSYDAETQEVVAKRLWDGTIDPSSKDWDITPAYAKLRIGSDQLETVVNNAIGTITLDVAPYIKDGRTLVPVRAISESFGATVEWDGATSTVSILSNNIYKTYGIFYNGKYYFDFKRLLGELTAFQTSTYGSSLIWDGENVYEGTFCDDKQGADGADIFFKSSNMLLRENVTEGEDSNGIRMVTYYYYLEDLNGNNQQPVIKFTEHMGRNGSNNLVSSIDYELYSHPEWFVKGEDKSTPVLTAPGTYYFDFTNGERPMFRPNISMKKTYKDFSKEYPAYISGGKLYYTELSSGEKLEFKLPFHIVSSLSDTYVGEESSYVYPTARYVFIRVDLTGSNAGTSNRGAYAFDKFTKEFITIKASNTVDITCVICNQAGHQMCQGHSCSGCNGAGLFTCNGCRGTGLATHYTQFQSNKCKVCYGLGTQICPNCDGAGKLFY